jgi:hypothetical protein
MGIATLDLNVGDAARMSFFAIFVRPEKKKTAGSDPAG